jgi:hypothetical protein
LLYRRISMVIFATVLAVILLRGHLASAEERYSRLGVDDGLPNTTIYSMQQDKTGFLCIGYITAVGQGSTFWFTLPHAVVVIKQPG